VFTLGGRTTFSVPRFAWRFWVSDPCDIGTVRLERVTNIYDVLF